jgi:hypothetical protein
VDAGSDGITARQEGMYFDIFPNNLLHTARKVFSCFIHYTHRQNGKKKNRQYQ